jgi:hypothetical protein
LPLFMLVPAIITSGALLPKDDRSGNAASAMFKARPSSVQTTPMTSTWIASPRLE